jgi:hypothetical protein
MSLVSTKSPVITGLKKLALLAAPLLLLSGCFQVEEVVHIKTDGSGTIDETLTMSKLALAQIKAMQPSATPGAESKAFSLLDEQKLKDQAAKMGEGVTYVSAKKIQTDTSEGFVATFAFADINKVKLSPAPAPNMGNNMSVSDDNKAITFKFDKPKLAVLRVFNPTGGAKEEAKPEEKGKDTAKADPNADAMKAMMLQVLKDMRVVVRIEPDGKIMKTNSSYHEGGKVTLLDIDFNKVLADPDKATQLTKIKDQNSPEALNLLKSIPGVSVETANPTIIRFQ